MAYSWCIRNSEKEQINKLEEPNSFMGFNTLRGLLKHNKLQRKDLEKIDSKYLWQINHCIFAENILSGTSSIASL